ncbi:MAG: ATP-binding cassette domain-containing protein, partial [Thermoflavifilum sp.]|nr:ATP-binding cassette domain-containing protein [Thermoflavifilum sp.]
MRRVIFQFEDACIYRGQRCIVDHLHWGVRRGTCVAVTGPNRSGKTTVLKAIAGKIPLSKGWIRYFPEHRTEPVEVMKPHQLGWVDFHAADLVLGHPDAFYQQRYYASQTHGLVMARSLLQAHATDVLGMHPREWEKQLRRLCDQQLFPADLLDRQVQQLSNGELKKLLILKALLAQPELLLLNAPFTGLDPVSRLQLKNMLQQIRQQGVTLVMEVLPEEANDMFDDLLPLPMQDKDFHPEKTIFPISFPSTLPEHIPLFELQDVHVRYGDHQILKQINWRVYPGQRWLICGQNGSGKSTLLSLITTDHPQAYAQRVFWKGKRRGSGETIWDIKREQAHVSPEMHYYLRTRLGSLSWLMQQQAWRISAPGSRSAVEQQALQYLRYWGMEQQAHQP